MELAKTLTELGIGTRQLGVVFEDLRVQVEGVAEAYQPSLVDALSLRSIQSLRRRWRTPTRDILSGLEGTVRPGEMLLVLGRPGSGCSTLLKTLANQRSDYSAVHGTVSYDSFDHTDIHRYHRGDVVYCPEDDVHFPSLTVEQTIQFAARLRGGESANDYTEALMEVFGLKSVRSTLVGDAKIRGVSGGQKKRVSLAEVMALRASLAAWDNPTRGLDSATALEFIQALRTATDVANMTTIASLYQAGESLYNLFDKVCVLYDGRVAFFGPASSARSYFITMGYTPANRQTTADFLVAVTDPNGRIPSSLSLALPRSAAEFASYYGKSDTAAVNREDILSFKQERVGQADLAHNYREDAHRQYDRWARKDSPFVSSLALQTRAVILRRLQILRGDLLATGIYIFSFVFQGLITGSLYLNLGDSTSSFFSRSGVLFFALFQQAVTSMAEVVTLFSQRPIVQRQSSWALYHPFLDQIALTLVDLPVTFASNAVFAVLLYEMAQLEQTAGSFFIFFLFVFVQAVVTKTWLRALTALMPDPVSAQGAAGLSVLTYVLYAGYSVPPPSMPKALKWVSYLTPIRWSLEAAMTNEFSSVHGVCAALVPQGPGYENVTLANQVCTVVGSVPGQATVEGRKFLQLSYGFVPGHLWRNFGFIIAFGIAFFAALLVITEISIRIMTSHDIVLFKRSSSSRALRPHQAEDIECTPQSTKIDMELESVQPSDKLRKLETSSTEDVFSWEGLSYSVPTKEGPRRLLNGVSGYVAPGKLTALMGESGAGKTTLLNVLAGRMDVGVVTGHRFLNGQDLPGDFQSQTAYCQQQDTHIGTSTVQEALLFSAQLRQPASVPLIEKLAYVDTCIELCGLSQFRNAAVGSLSIENKKRTSIAVELAAKPKLLLFLDEPTSGLDSQSAWNIVLFLRDLANAGQAILCTIHQPSAELFQMFDRLLLLRRGGETVYFGDLGHNAETVLRYFQNGGARVCGDGENPAEYVLDVIGAGATASSAEDWHSIWMSSKEVLGLETDLKDIHTRRAGVASSTSSAAKRTYTASWGKQVLQLVKRGMSGHNRDPSYLLSMFGLNLLAGLFVGLTFYQSDNSQQGTHNKLFAVFMASIIAMPMANQVQLPFFTARDIYEIRERPSRMYSWSALVFSQVLIQLPWAIVASSLFYLCWYWTVGFPSDRASYSWLMLGVMFPVWYTTIGQAVAAMSPNPEVGILVFGVLFSFVLPFCGIIQPYSRLGWWNWMYRVTPFTYFIEGLFGQALGRQEIECAALEVVTLAPPSGQTCAEYMNPYISYAGGYLTNPDATSDCGFCSTTSSDTFLETQFNIFYDNRWRDIGVMAAFIVFNILMTFAFMWFFRIRTRSVWDIIRGRKKRPA